MIARRHLVALVITGILAAGAACQADERVPDPRPGAPGPAAARGFTLVATGAIVPHTSVVERARFDAGGAGHDFRPMLEGVKPLVAGADLALCHLDTVFGANAGTAARPLVKSPPEMADALAATGYDSCSTASAHSLDDGAVGIRRTLDALDGAGVRHAGTSRTEAEAGSVTLLRAGPAKVAHLAYTADTGGRALPAGQPRAVHRIDENRVVADAKAARAAGADVVVVSLHWGTEWQDTPDDVQLDLARSLTASRTGGRADIDLILGTHAHVPQPYEKVNGTWVVYGLGDLVAGEMPDKPRRPDPRGRQSSAARFTFAKPARPGGRWEVTKAAFVPHLFDIDAGRAVNLDRALAQGADVRGVRDRIEDIVLSRLAAKAGLTMGE